MTGRRLPFAGFLLATILIVPARLLLAQVEAPKLDRLPPPTAGIADQAPARPLPRMQVICIDRGQKRCWSADHPDDCSRAGGFAFAITTAGADDVGSRLRACWDTVR